MCTFVWQRTELEVFCFAMLKGKQSINTLEPQKSLYVLVVVDLVGLEVNFARELEKESVMVVYTKLSDGFYSNTHVCHYNPNWFIVFKKRYLHKCIYFVAEAES